MKPELSLLSVVIFVALLACACTYTTDEEFFNELAKPSLEGVDITVESDTIYLYKKKSFTYPFNLADKTVYRDKVSFNGKNVPSDIFNDSIWFELDPAEIETGIYPLEITAVLSGHTGSLADHLQEEEITFQEILYVKVDLTPPARLAAPEVVIEDGRSWVKWQPAEKQNFLEYCLIKSYLNADNEQINDTIRLDNGTHAYHDSLYVGGKVQYAVDLEGYTFYSKGETTDFYLDPVQVDYTVNSDETVSFRWSDFKLYNNAISLKFFGSTYDELTRSYSGKLKLLEPRSPAQEGEITVPHTVRFGNPYFYTFAIYQANQTLYNLLSQYKENFELAVGSKIHSYNFINFCSETDKMYLTAIDKENDQLIHFYQYSLSALTVLDSISIEVNDFYKPLISANGRHLYLLDRYENDVKFIRIDPQTLSLEQNFMATAIIEPIQYSEIEVTSISNLNTASLEQGGRYHPLVNLSDKSVSWSLPDSIQTSSLVVSEDGEYLLSDYYKKRYDGYVGNWYTQVLRFNGSEWEAVGEIREPYEGRLLTFNTGPSGSLIYFFKRTAMVTQIPFKSSGFQSMLFYPLALEDLYIKNYNALHDNLNVSFSNPTDKFLGLYDFRSGQIVNQLAYDGYRNASFEIYDNIYFANSGYYYVVD